VAVSPFAKKLATIAQEQHAQLHFINEADPALCTRIRQWTTDIGFPFESCTDVAWSAVFVSWCVKNAGATSTEFKFAMRHSEFVHQAIKNAKVGEGVFQGFEVAAEAPSVGDIIQNNRDGNSFDFGFASTHKKYVSHSVIVVETGEDNLGRFAFCIGGNENDSIRQTVIRTDANGFIKQRPANPFICVVKNLK
jgi:hypothetical protein